MTETTPLRILFLHATWPSTSEYKVHIRLAENADQNLIDSFFIWQTFTQDKSFNSPAHLIRDNRNFFYDFGRDMHITPKLPKWKRALLMLLRFPPSIFFLSKKIITIKPDIIYTSQQFYEVFLARLLSSSFRIPHFIHISYPVGPWLGKNTLKTILHTPDLIACSDFVRNTALIAGVKPEHIETLLHGANVEKYNIRRNSEWLKEEFNLPSNAKIVITAARLDPGKGYRVLLEAISKVREKIPTVRLIACGGGTTGSGYAQKIKQLAVDFNVNDIVTFTGFRNDLPQLYAGSDIFCLPTKEDALPLVFLGAMASQLPVAAVHSGGVPEMVLHEESGLLSQPDDADALARNLIILLEDKELAKNYGAKGREIALTKFNPETIAQEWTNILFRRLNKPTAKFDQQTYDPLLQNKQLAK